jgi:hypothetical protein
MLTVESQSCWSWGTNCRNHCSFPLLASSTIIAAVYRFLAHPRTAGEIPHGIADGDVERAVLCVQRRSYPATLAC